ncbi:RagB/SusD family nutrient uptake outer membrane protein [Membranihabitans marinus]|uniref:RagB/SusD family nutrient uptake outer membrane protein n=1 Tax=Membranihabitans marinus TaxID=1227546 RepID=UPI001F392371|nr:RagB/SusD family nutrient uptake outer membrane protein [Membranihabitans marinus]
MKYLIFYIIAVFAITSCSEDLLELSPISSPNVESYFKSQSDFENALVGAYSILKSDGVYNDYVQLVGEVRSDNSEMGTTASNRVYLYEMSEFRDQSTSPIYNSIWTQHYKGINLANLIIKNIVDLDAPESFKNRVEGEAKFLRSLYYFNLVRIFGSVPLVASSLNSIADAYDKSRAETSEIYNLIIEDLEYSKSVLQANPIDVGRATKGAATALLGKVYLTLHDYNNAKISLEEVIQSGQYALLDDFADLWEASNKNHSESIFDVQFQRGSGSNTGSRFLERYSPYLYPHLPYYTTGGGYNIPTIDLINAFEENDNRKDASLKEFYVVGNDTISGLAGRFCYKFHDLPTQQQGSDDNWPVIRYADVILMYAEVLNEISFEANGLAFDYLNMIRSRAGLPNKTANNTNIDLSIDSQAAFREAIAHERRVELAFEGHRWFDLVRTQKMIDVMNPKTEVEIQDYMSLLPIPQSQIDINPGKITQNQGY